MGKDVDNLDLYATLELFKNAITSASHLRAKICYLGISMEIQSIPKVVYTMVTIIMDKRQHKSSASSF